MAKVKSLWQVAALVAVQAFLVLVYVGIERRGGQGPAFRWETLDEAAPALFLTRDGAAVAVPSHAHLVHFWATWCAPCREELPTLLAAADAAGIPLVAVTDEPWPVVDRYFGGEVPSAVVQDPQAATAWRASSLPDTFAVRKGRVIARMGGPRDWRTADARRFLHDLAPQE